ncbi:MAG: histidine phosphatase family protein [Cytophagales bacterium]|nr:histidine phosphatase family protein [Cytophagales bacterium]
MKSKKIYLVRHGQTDYNLKGIVQGSGIDADLNDRGRQQAVAFFEAFKHVKFDKVYTSTLKRTKQSVKAFLEMGLPHEEWAGLNEISWGSREGTIITPEEDAYYHEVIQKWQEGETGLRIEGGESPQDVFDRQKPVLSHILDQKEEKTILICMHGRAMRVLLCQILNYPLRCMDMFEHSNLCLYMINFTGSMFSIERFNDTRHLKELVST